MSSIEIKLLNLRTDVDNASCTKFGKYFVGWLLYPIKILVIKPALKVAEIVLPPVVSVVPHSELVIGFLLSIVTSTAHLIYSIGSDIGLFKYDANMCVIPGGALYSFGLSLVSALFDFPRLCSWYRTISEIFGYLISSGMASEAQKEIPDLAVNFILLTMIKEKRKRSFESNGTIKTSDLEEGKYFMKYATAAYGIDTMVATQDQLLAAKAAQEKRNSMSSEAGEVFFDEYKQKEYLKRRRKASASIMQSLITIQQPGEEEYLKQRRKASASIMQSLIIGHPQQNFELFDESEKPTDEFREKIYEIVNATDQQTLEKISSHVGIKTSQIEYMFVKPGGSVKCLRHFIAVDHKKKAVVLSIRGTFSVTGVLIDLTFYTEKFCGGEAHSGFIKEIEKIWEYAGPKVKLLLKKYPMYELIITGHSLGAGCACLLTLKCYHDGLVGNRKVRCYAFSSPTVYTPLEDAPEKCKEAIANTIVYIHDNDFIAFLSGHSTRKLLQSLEAVGEAEKSLFNRIRIIAGLKELSQELIDAVEAAEGKPLCNVERCPRLYIPAEKIIWMRGNTDAGYEAYLYKSKDLPEGIHASKDMLTDHVPCYFEEALCTLTNDL